MKSWSSQWVQWTPPRTPMTKSIELISTVRDWQLSSSMIRTRLPYQIKQVLSKLKIYHLGWLKTAENRWLTTALCPLSKSLSTCRWSRVAEDSRKCLGRASSTRPKMTTCQAPGSSMLKTPLKSWSRLRIPWNCHKILWLMKTWRTMRGTWTPW